MAPQLELDYNSQGSVGLAGYGWNIGGVATITRIPATKFHDNAIDAVDFDALDRFALNGERLIMKNQTNAIYGGNGIVYETENFSNTKITSYGTHPKGANYGPAYFLVEYPDGSKAYFGNSSDSRSISEWSITYWENAQKLSISYYYNHTNNLLEIASIKYGSKGTAAPINEIQFTYEARSRAEESYLGGEFIKRANRLKEIKSLSNNAGFRYYTLDYQMAQSSENYDRLYSITEKSGDQTKSYNPTVFSYNNTDNSISYFTNPNTLSVDNVSSLNASTVSGDFDGDGNMDFILYPTTGTAAKTKYWLFTGINPNIGAQTLPNMGMALQPGKFEDIVPVNFLSWNNKLMSYQGWTVIQINSSTGSTDFKTYATDTSTLIYPQGEKTYNFPFFSYYSEHPLSCIQNRPPILNTVSVPKRYLGGDFNGDGITDIAAIEINFSYSYLGPCDINDEPLPVNDLYFGNTYFLDLDRRLTSNYINNAGNLNVLESSKTYVADFNGDNKSDIYVFENGKVKIYTLNESKQFILLYQNTIADSSLVTNKPILIGDFNGDGKSDFMLPVESNNGWYRYVSTGTSFIKETKNYAWLVPNDSSNSYNYAVTDYDNDGKSDLTIIKNSRNSSTGLGTIQVTAITDLGGTSTHSFSASTAARSDINIYALPIYLNSNNQQRPRFEIAFINNNKLHFFGSQKNTNKDRLLTVITTGNGVQEFISYQPLDQIYKMNFNSVYNPTPGTETYPYFDIVASQDFQIATKIEKKSATASKMKLYGYCGAVSNVEGLGFMGFRSMMESTWHDISNSPLCTITNYDFKKRGAVTESYFLPSLAYPYYGFVPSNYTTKSIFGYSPNDAGALQQSGVFKLQNTSIVQYNSLENSSTETTILYNENSNPLNTTTVTKEGSNIIKTVSEGIEYESPNPETPYIIDRPYSRVLRKTIAGSDMYYAELYEYNSDNLLYVTEKYGFNTQSILELYYYDTYGNLTKKDILSTDADKRTTQYEYDASGRFLTKIIDNDNLATIFEYYPNNGLLKKETSPYGLSTSYTYDPWFKKITAKDDQLNKTISTTYQCAYASSTGYETTVTTTSDPADGSVIEDKFDDLGRKIRTGSKNLNDVFTYTSFLYDIFDRNYKISEPYFGSSPSQWNETKFDIYNRPTQNILYNNRTISTSYNGLSTIITDGAKTKTINKNAAGDIISSNETLGGTINFSYFADGNLKQSTYNGTNIIVEQDGWGRRTKLTDPSAGIFTYKYNDLGEMVEETSQNGAVKTILVRDSSGRPIKKTVTGAGTDTQTDYVYNADKLPLTITYEDKNEPVGYNKIITTVSYDPTSKKIISVEENKIGISKFTSSYSYDNLGRIQTETKLAEIGGKSSAVSTKNIYKNGDLYQILDLNDNLLWQTNTLNPKGQVLESITGSGIKMTNGYDSDGYLSTIKHNKSAEPLGSLLNLSTTFNKNTDNLDSRTSDFGNFAETFKYDEINRLKEYTNMSGTQQSQSYDASGKITANNLGIYNYDPLKKYQNTSITLTAEAAGYYSNRQGIFNDAFENKSGWGTERYPSNVFFSYDSTKLAFIKGKFTLKLANSQTTEQYVYSDKWTKINNSALTSYTYSAWYFSDGPQAEIFLFMKDEAGNETFTSVTRTEIGGWHPITGSFNVPPNIKYVRMRIDNNGQGNIWYDNAYIGKDYEALDDRKLNVTYNASKNPISVEENKINKISFTYNDNNTRSVMYYNGPLDEKFLRRMRKHYSADGSMEIKENRDSNTFEFITYISGDGYSAPIAVRSDGTTQNYLYLHRDYQGSIVAISDQSGTVLERRSFDAWGSIVDVQDKDGKKLTGISVLDRGYTGHEHLQSVGLINMNARLYDPMLHRFLQADNYIQDPTSTQNYNQYGYVMNNPLLYTDPSGNKAVDPKCDYCNNGEISNGQQTFIGSLIGTVVTNWDEWRIKDWANKNLNFKKWDYWRKEKISLNNIFGKGGKKSSPPPPPNRSTNVDITSKNITPFQVGVEWLSGQGARSRYFTNGDNFTEMLRKHSHVQDTREIIISNVNSGGKLYDSNPYELGGVRGVGLYLKDYSTLLTGGLTGNLAVTYLGSYNLKWVATPNYKNNTVLVQFSVKNTSTMQSASRPPVLGYLPIWQNTVGKAINEYFQEGWGSKTTQTFYWTETLKLK